METPVNAVLRWVRKAGRQGTFVDEYRAAIGQVPPDGDLATWLEWLGRRRRD